MRLLPFVNTKHRCLVSGTENGRNVYANASYRHRQDARSTAGYVVLLHGAAVAWGSKLQTCAALSTTDIEVQPAVSAGRVAIWTGQSLSELGQALAGLMTVNGDNLAALSLLAKNCTPGRTHTWSQLTAAFIDE